MDRNTKYSAIALGSVAVFAVVIGTAAYFSNRAQVTASIESPQTEAPLTSSYPLRVGWNEITNSKQTLTQDSKIVKTNQGQYSLKEAQDMGIIGKIVVGADNMIFGQETNTIAPLEKFSVFAVEISEVPVIILGGQ